MTTDSRVPWAWLALAVFVIAGAGIPEVAELLRWTMLVALIYLLLTHAGDIDRLASTFLGGLVK